MGNIARSSRDNQSPKYGVLGMKTALHVGKVTKPSVGEAKSEHLKPVIDGA